MHNVHPHVQQELQHVHVHVDGVYDWCVLIRIQQCHAQTHTANFVLEILCTLHPTLHTPHPTHHTSHPTPLTLHITPHTSHPTPPIAKLPIAV